MKKRMFALFLCLLLCVAIVPTVFAGSDEPTSGIASEDPYFTDQYYSENSGISTYAAPVFKSPLITISSPSTGKISIYVKAQTASTCTKIGFQEQSGVAVLEWQPLGHQCILVGKYNTNATSYTFSQTLDRTSGTRYQLTGTLFATNASGTTTYPFTTKYITCK